MATNRFQFTNRSLNLLAMSQKAHLAAAIVIGYAAVCSPTASEAAPLASDNQEVINRVISDINIAPDHACSLPQTAIQDWLAGNVNAHGLMDNVFQSVFHEEPDTKPALSALEAKMNEINEETRRLAAQAAAVYHARETGGQTPVGDQSLPDIPKYGSEMRNIRAVRRVPNGLDCSAAASVGALRFEVSYNVLLNPNDNDGWTSNIQAPLIFNEAAALIAKPAIMINYNGYNLTLAQARQQSQINLAAKIAADARTKQQNTANRNYEISPVGRAAAAQRRQTMVAKQRACEAHGGTWGVPGGDIIYQVDARTAAGLAAMEQACYFLGK